MKNLKKLQFSLSAMALLTLIGCNDSSQDVTLFDGKTLDGWVNYGGGNFYVQDGMIVGETQVGLPNSFLATEAMYTDFEMEVDFMIDPTLNSGIQLRSNVYAEETTTIRWGGTFKEDGSKDVKERVWEKGRFWGYQVEIDPTDRGWSGTLYEEGARGFLHTPGEDEAALKAFKANEWNHLRILVKGDHFQTWLNGVPVADVHDSLTPTGYIALQLHGIGNNAKNAGKKVMWKNIELTVF